MEYQIEIVGVETEQLHRQLHKAAMGKIFGVATAVFALALLWAVWKAINTGEIVYGITAVMYLLLAIWVWNAPDRFARKSFADKLRYYNGNMPTSTVRFGDHITQEDVDSSIIIPYDKVSYIRFLPDGIAVGTAQKKVYGFPNREFTKGSLAELKALLRHKRPDLVIPE